MPIDVTIQFNGHNSYQVTETVWDKPYGVEGMAYITHSFHVYATSALGAATRARTRFFAADGSIVGTTDHSFTVGVIFAEVDITVPVPALAVLMQLCFFTSGTWWVVEPKTEEGETATPYNTNYSGQLSMLTPDGAYLGNLTTAQIVVAGTLANPTESLYTRLVTINANAINLSATSGDHGSRLTSIEAGVIVISGSASYAAGYDPSTKETPTGAQAKVNALGTAINAALGDLAYEDLVEIAKLGTTVIVGGYLKNDVIETKSITGAKLADGTVGDLQVASGLSALKITSDKLQSADGKTYFDLGTGKIHLDTIIGGKAVVIELNTTGGLDVTVDSVKVGGLLLIGGQLAFTGSILCKAGNTNTYISLEPDPNDGTLDVARFYAPHSGSASEFLRVGFNNTAAYLRAMPIAGSGNRSFVVTTTDYGSADGAEMVLWKSSSGNSASIRVRNGADNTEISQTPTSITFSRNGSTLATW